MPIPVCAHTLCCYKQKQRYNFLCSVWLSSKNDTESHFSKLSLAELPKVLELTFQEPYVWFGHMLLFCCVVWEACTGGRRKSCISICSMTFLKGKNIYDQNLSPQFWRIVQKEHIQQDERHMSSGRLWDGTWGNYWLEKLVCLCWDQRGKTESIALTIF